MTTQTNVPATTTAETTTTEAPTTTAAAVTLLVKLLKPIGNNETAVAAFKAALAKLLGINANLLTVTQGSAPDELLVTITGADASAIAEKASKLNSTELQQLGASSVSITTTPAPAEPKKLNIALIAGIAGGSLVVLIIVIVVVKKCGGSGDRYLVDDAPESSRGGRPMLKLPTTGEYGAVNQPTV